MIRRAAAWSLVVVAAAYVAANVIAIAFVPILHRAHVTVRVVGDTDRAPIPSIEVALVGSDGRPRLPPGTTDARGIASFELVFQAQPTWAFPSIGVIDPRVFVEVGPPEASSRVGVPPLDARDPRAEIEIPWARAISPVHPVPAEDRRE